MERIRIDIPSAKVPPAAYPAADIAIAALREAGLDPWKAAAVPMVRQLAGAWVRGEMDRAGFVKACRNVGILNPSIQEQPR
jgi:hypothetical protein